MCAERLHPPEGVDVTNLERVLAWDSRTNTTEAGPTGGTPTKAQSLGAPAGIAPVVIGIKGWVLGTRLHPRLQLLAGNIECLWREMFPDDLQITPMDPRWRLLDSMDVRQSGEVAYRTVDPQVCCTVATVCTMAPERFSSRGQTTEWHSTQTRPDCQTGRALAV